MERKNIIIAPCGNKSFLFNDKWLSKPEERNFDICLLFYHPEVQNPERYKDVDYFFHLKGFKFMMIHELLTKLQPELMDRYEYFYFLDDDIDIDTENINRMFDLSKAFRSQISQASLTSNSFCSWPILKNKPGCFARYVGQIEVMAPLFSREALQICLPSFIVNRSSWGLDSAWPKQLNYPHKKMIVFDEIQMAHTLPVGGGELYVKIQADPHEDWQAVVDQFGAVKNNFKEYGRLIKVDAESHLVHRQYYIVRGKLARLQQRINDFGLLWRIRNKLGMKQPD